MNDRGGYAKLVMSKHQKTGTFSCFDIFLALRRPFRHRADRWAATDGIPQIQGDFSKGFFFQSITKKRPMMLNKGNKKIY